MPDRQARERLAWPDLAKGVGIILVVIGHALGGLIDSPLGATLPAAYRAAFVAIYTFHMPLFFLLSGLFVQERVARGRDAFLRPLARTLVWPYFLWSTIQFTLIASLGGLVNKPAGDYWGTLIALPWKPVSQFWFLQTLLLLHVVTAVALRRVGPVTLLVIAVALKPLATILQLPDPLLYAAVEAPFYMLGVALGAGGVREVIVGRPWPVRLVLLPILAALLIARTVAVAPTLLPGVDFATTSAAGLARMAWTLPAVPAALAGTFAVIGIAAALRGRGAAVIATLGRRSLPIFILHVMVIAGTRILCTKILHLPYPGLILAVGVGLGLTLPLVAFAILDRLKLARPLGLA